MDFGMSDDDIRAGALKEACDLARELRDPMSVMNGYEAEMEQDLEPIEARVFFFRRKGATAPVEGPVVMYDRGSGRFVSFQPVRGSKRINSRRGVAEGALGYFMGEGSKPVSERSSAANPGTRALVEKVKNDILEELGR